MPTGEAKTRFTLEGEQKFKSAMTEAANAVKVLNSEQKLAKAQFKATGDAEKYAAEKTQLLQQKMEAQKNAIKAAEQAIKQLTENGVNKNSRQMQIWQEKLFKAQTELANMQNDLKDTGAEIEKVTGQTEKMNNSLDSIGKKVSFDAVIGGLDKITNTAWAAAQKITSLAMGLKDTMRDAAAWADDLATQSVVYNIDTDTLQRMQYTASILDTSVENIIKSRQKLINNMVYGSDEVKSLFNELGISVREYELGALGDVTVSEYRDWADVFWDVGEALMNLDDYEEASAKATKLFGKSWEQLLPIFNSDWASQLDENGEQLYHSAREFYDATMQKWDVVSDENIGKLTALDDALQELKNHFTTLEMTVLSELAPGLEKLAEGASALLVEFNKYLQTDEGKEKMQKLSDAVMSLFSSVTDLDFSSAVETAASAIGRLTEGLEWIKNNWGGVRLGLFAIGSVLGTMKVASSVLSFLQMWGGAKFLFNKGGGKDAAKTATAKAAETAAVASGGTNFVPNIVKKIAGSEFVKGVATYDPAGSLALLPFVLEDYTTFGTYLKNGATMKEAATAQADKIKDFVSSVPERLSSWYKESYWPAIMGWFSEQGQAMIDAVELLNEQNNPENNVIARNIMNLNTEWEDFKHDFLKGAVEDATAVLKKWEEDHSASSSALFDPDELQTEWENLVDLFLPKKNRLNGEEGVPITVEPEAPENSAEDIAKQVGPVEIPAILMVTSDKSGPHMKLGSFSSGGPAVFYYSKDLNEHANGIWSVPFDGYPAILHRGERVTPEREVSSRNYNSNLYVEKMIMNNGTDAQGLANAMAAAQRRRMSGYGS